MRSDDDRVDDILRAIDRIERKTTGSKQAIREEEMLQTWVVHHLEIIGEAAKGLSDEFRSARPHIPWSAIARMRDRLINGYWDVDMEAVLGTVERDLPQLRSALTGNLPDHRAPAVPGRPLGSAALAELREDER